MQRLITYADAAAHGCWREVAADILLIPFWNGDFCSDIIRAAELVDEFKPYAPDVRNNAAPGQEVRINRISPKFAENFEAHFQARITPIIQTHWWPLKPGKTRMPFVLRYSADTQSALDPHHDAAMVSFAVPLNRGYEGGVLTFPRQHWDSREVPPGNIIAFPSRVTHVHWVTPVTSGKRYALTAWLAAPGNPPADPIVP
ncbi:MAG: 2OG-Fe(II) oxygenase [Gammaproteobacteria bacterium]